MTPTFVKYLNITEYAIITCVLFVAAPLLLFVSYFYSKKQSKLILLVLFLQTSISICSMPHIIYMLCISFNNNFYNNFWILWTGHLMITSKMSSNTAIFFLTVERITAIFAPHLYNLYRTRFFVLALCAITGLESLFFYFTATLPISNEVCLSLACVLVNSSLDKFIIYMETIVSGLILCVGLTFFWAYKTRTSAKNDKKNNIMLMTIIIFQFCCMLTPQVIHMGFSIFTTIEVLHYIGPGLEFLHTWDVFANGIIYAKRMHLQRKEPKIQSVASSGLFKQFQHKTNRTLSTN